MTWLRVALIIVVLTFALFTWALCRIAADSDRRMKD